MASSYYPKIVTDGLVMCLDGGNRESYPGSGATWSDVSGRGLSCAFINSPTFNASNLGGITFNGSTQYGNITPLSSFSYGTSSCTMEGWAFATSVATQWAYIMHYGTASASNARSIGLGSTSFLVSEWGAAYDLAYTATTLNRWFHLVGVFNSTTEYMYLNGVQVASKAVVPNTLSSVATIGRESAAGGQNYFAGTIARVSYYNRELTAAEILQNFNAHRGRFGI